VVLGRFIDGSLVARAKSVEVKFLSLCVNFLCNLKVGPLYVTVDNPVSVQGSVTRHLAKLCLPLANWMPTKCMNCWGQFRRRISFLLVLVSSVKEEVRTLAPLSVVFFLMNAAREKTWNLRNRPIASPPGSWDQLSGQLSLGITYCWIFIRQHDPVILIQDGKRATQISFFRGSYSPPVLPLQLEAIIFLQLEAIIFFQLEALSHSGLLIGCIALRKRHLLMRLALWKLGEGSWDIIKCAVGFQWLLLL